MNSSLGDLGPVRVSKSLIRPFEPYCNAIFVAESPNLILDLNNLNVSWENYPAGFSSEYLGDPWS
jgi:hypothetical protein